MKAKLSSKIWLAGLAIMFTLGLASCSNQTVSDQNYAVQLFASKAVNKAESIKNTFAKEGYKAYVSQATVDGQVVHRVRIGPYDSEAKAKAALDKMKARYQQNAYVKGAVIKEDP